MSFLLKILQIERGPPLQLTIVHVRWNESFKFWFLTGFLYHYSYNTTCHSPNFNVACNHHLPQLLCTSFINSLKPKSADKSTGTPVC